MISGVAFHRSILAAMFALSTWWLFDALYMTENFDFTLSQIAFVLWHARFFLRREEKCPPECGNKLTCNVLVNAKCIF